MLSSHTSQNRARYGGIFAITLFSGMLGWALIVQHEFTNNNPGKLDWEGFPRFGRGFGLCESKCPLRPPRNRPADAHPVRKDVMLNTAGNVLQNYLYWSLGSIGSGTSELTRYAGLLRGIESFGQCAAFGINSSHFSRESLACPTSAALPLGSTLTLPARPQLCTPSSSTSSSGPCRSHSHGLRSHPSGVRETRRRRLRRKGLSEASRRRRWKGRHERGLTGYLRYT